MDEVERLRAIEEIKQVKASYFRGVDTNDSELVRGILAEDCVLDYTGAWIDPKTGRDYLPAPNRVIRGSASWPKEGPAKLGVVSVHQGHNCEITFTSDVTAEVIWSMSDRVFLPPGSVYSQRSGYGYYHEAYEKINGRWKIKALRISRLRVETS